MINNILKQKIYDYIADILSGKVVTYGIIGRTLKIHPRLVGRILHQNPDPDKYPCHRVVSSKGMVAAKYAFGGGEVQRKKLEEEGIVFENNKIDLKKSLPK